MIERFDTERLSARVLEESDFDSLYKLYTDEKVCETLGGVKTSDWVEAYITKNLEHLEKYGFGLWIFDHKQSGTFAGRGAIRYMDIDGADEIELGYALMPEYWGQGLAAEMARSLIKIAFENHKITELISITQPTNKASRRVMEKCGFKFEKDVIYSNLQHVLYRLKNKVYSY